MTNRINDLLSILGGSVSIAAGTVQTSEIREWIMFGIGIISFLVPLAIRVIQYIRKWNLSLQDGKIDEAEDKSLKESEEQIIDEIKKGKDNDKI